MPSGLIRGQSPLGIQPVVGGGTGSGVAATALANLGGLATADHPNVDHSVIASVMGGKFTFVTPADVPTIGTLNTLFSTYDVVFMLPGAYNWGSTNGVATVGDDKHLIGWSSYAGIGGTYINLSGTSQGFYIGRNGSIQNLSFQMSNPASATSTELFRTLSSYGIALLKNIWVDMNANANRTGQRIVYGATSSLNLRVENLFVQDTPASYSTQCIYVRNDTNGFGYAYGHDWGGAYGCHILGGGQSVTTGVGIFAQNCNVVACVVRTFSGIGISWQANAYNPTRIVNNLIYDCNSYGIYSLSSGSSSGWTEISGNKVVLCSDWGYYMPQALSLYKGGFIHDNYGAANTNGDFNLGTMYHFVDNYA